MGVVSHFFLSIYYCFRGLGKEGTRLVICVDDFTLFDVYVQVCTEIIEVETAVFFLQLFILIRLLGKDILPFFL